MQNANNSLKLLQLPLQAKFYAVSFILMAFATCTLLAHSWNNRLDYSFGYLTPIFVLYILFDRYPKISSVFSTHTQNASNKFLKYFCDFFFGSMLILGCLVFLAFALIFANTMNWGVPTFAMTFGFVFASFAMTYFSSTENIYGEQIDIKSRLKYVCLFVFPCFIWLISAPLFVAVEDKISLFLLSKVAIITVNIMETLGFIVELKGNTISFPKGTVGVADACSGIRSLTACLFAGSFLAAALLDKLWKKISLVGLSMCFAFLFNLVRALFLSFWAYENGSESIGGTVHDAAGYFVLGMTVVGLLIFVSLFNINPVPKEFRNADKK